MNFMELPWPCYNHLFCFLSMQIRYSFALIGKLIYLKSSSVRILAHPLFYFQHIIIINIMMQELFENKCCNLEIQSAKEKTCHAQQRKEGSLWFHWYLIFFHQCIDNSLIHRDEFGMIEKCLYHHIMFYFWKRKMKVIKTSELISK